MQQDLSELAALAAAGDREAMAEILRRFAPLKISLIKKYFGYGIDWDDFLAEGDRLMIESVMNYDPGRKVPLESYLKINLSYLYINIRKKQRRLVYLDQEISEGITLADTLEADDPPVDEPVIGRDESDEVREALSRLTERQKTIIELYYYQGKSVRQCAEIMGTAYQTAVELKGRAVRALADALKNFD